MTSMANLDVLVVGEINADLILSGDVVPAFGQVEKLVDDATLTLGSSAVIFACGAARLGLRVAFSGLVGDDVFGGFMLDGLRTRGVDTGGVLIDPSLKTGLTVHLSLGVDRAMLTHVGAIPHLRADQVDRKLLANARHVHVTSYYLQDGLRPGLPGLLAEAQERGLTVSLDTNWDPAERWNGGLAQVLDHVDVCLPNEMEARGIAGRSDRESALDRLASQVATVAMKLGSEGAVARRGDERVACPALSVDAVDTTGAGDSFDAGFIFGLLRGYSLEAALRIGSICGALSTRAVGGTDAQPTVEEAKAHLDGWQDAPEAGRRDAR